MSDFFWTFLGLMVGFLFFVAHLALARNRAWKAGYDKGYEHAREDFAAKDRVERL